MILLDLVIELNQTTSFDVIDFLTMFFTAVTVVVSVAALCYASKEYKLHKDVEKANTLANYNQRYSTDEYIYRVVSYLIEIEKRKGNENFKKMSKEKREAYYKKYDDDIKEYNNNIEIYYCRIKRENKDKLIPIPSENDKELFLRFFEEIEYSIEQKALERKAVKDLFFYYAGIAYDMGSAFIEDFDKNHWNRFKKFVREMR